VSLRTALTDVLASAGLFRVPIIIEYEELKTLQLNAVTDPLTGLYNRRLFAETFDKELNRARRYGLPLAIAILDLHRFKEVNDKHGHPRGDDVLRAAATTLKKALRTSDSAFRIGGDEFALLLPQTDAAQALALSRRIETVFAETLRPLHLTVAGSMDHGVATFPHDGEQADQLIRVADERLYRLKHANHKTTASKTEQQTPPQPQTEPHPQGQQSPPSRIETSAPQPISIESGRPAERAESAAAAASGPTGPREPSSEASSPTPPGPHLYAVQRKAERVSMSGTNAYATLGDPGTKRARVLDLGFGGVALELDAPEELPENILAVLHVPILPPVRVSLKPVWSQHTTQGGYRIGCAFIS
jgi:diguanylate cyclase (GGDEF)-like protein